MSIDLEQFHQVFFEESLEGLDIMETSLMELDPDAIDSETINAIFRSAHSIKGGSATFGFTDVTEFTHVLETLLDEVRDEKRGLSSDDIDLLLKSVDCMREMLAMAQAGEPGSTESSESLKQAFEAILSGDSSAPTEASVSSQESTQSGTGSRHFNIVFKPEVDLFLSGNDPARILTALQELGDCEIHCDVSELPSFTSLDSEKSFLSWTISLSTEKAESDIQEVFEWVEDHCELEIIAGESSNASAKDEAGASSWHIQFVPSLDVLKTGNDPARLIRSLKELGNLQIQTDISKLPTFSSIDAENCYMSWKFTLTDSKASESDIQEVFEWVIDDSEVTIRLDSSGSTNTVAAASAEVTVEPKADAAPTQASAPAVAAAKPAPKKAAKPAAKKVAAETSSIRVGIDKVDNLINMVGELVITQSMLGQLSSQLELEKVPNLVEGLSQLEQNTRELQESVMKIRMLPISFVFSRFPRMVRDLGQSLDKSVELGLN